VLTLPGDVWHVPRVLSKCPMGREGKQHIVICKGRKSVKIHGKLIKRFTYLVHRGNTSSGHLSLATTCLSSCAFLVALCSLDGEQWPCPPTIDECN